MLALIKKKYGLCREEMDTTDSSGLKQTNIKIEIPKTSSNATNSPSSLKSKELPEWLKRSNVETKESSDQAHNSDKEKPKKKPKLF